MGGAPGPPDAWEVQNVRCAARFLEGGGPYGVRVARVRQGAARGLGTEGILVLFIVV